MKRSEIVSELVSDHWQIRELLRGIRDEKAGSRGQVALLQKLGIWLRWHAAGEEKTINSFSKGRRALSTLACEDSEEHSTIDALLGKLERTSNPHLWTARLRLLCELVEQHLDEEEEEYLPFLKGAVTPEESSQLASRYRAITAELEPLRNRRRESVLSWISGQAEPGLRNSTFL
jgi:hypothetical protein